MLIEHNNTSLVAVKNIPYGECFKYAGEIYTRINLKIFGITAIMRLADGYATNFDDNNLVKPLKTILKVIDAD
jgi:hypothetical protein